MGESTASNFEVDLQALAYAARTFEAQAERLAGEIEVLSGLGAHSGGEGLHTGSGDLDVLIGGKVEEIIEALAGAGARLQVTSDNLELIKQRYGGTDAQVAQGMDGIQP